MSVNDLMRSRTLKWLNTGGNNGDVVLLSRIRLARNLRQIPFPNRADYNALAQVELQLDKTIPQIVEGLGQPFDRLDMEHISALQRQVLIEKQLISSNLVKNPQHRIAYISDDRRITIMANEEDHIRIQCTLAGFDLDHAWRLASDIDDCIENQVNLAFDEKMGYLTSCPTNLGTGMRASVVLHLPGLVYSRNMDSIVNLSPQLGLAVRSLFGTKENPSCIYRISNQLTLGLSEEELIENLKSTVNEIVAHERAARKALLYYMKDDVEDRIWRAYGTLRYARSLSEGELFGLLAKVRLGLDLKIIDEVSPECYGELLVGGRTSYLRNFAENENLSANEVDRLRAAYVRETLTRHRIGREE